MKRVVLALIMSLALAACGGVPHRSVQSEFSAFAERVVSAGGQNRILSSGEIFLHHAAAQGNAADVEKVIRAGTNVNRPDNEGNTPLIWAVRANNNDALSPLLSGGAAVNWKGSGGYTPMDWAIQADNTYAIRLLREYGGKCDREC